MLLILNFLEYNLHALNKKNLFIFRTKGCAVKSLVHLDPPKTTDPQNVLAKYLATKVFSTEVTGTGYGANYS